MNRRHFLYTAAGAAFSPLARAQRSQPNVILIYADDLGFGDLSCYGSRINTPNLDRMSQQGARFQHFYSASAVCSPSRAALLTGRYPARSGITGILGPGDRAGLPDSETTMAQMLKNAGYRTMCVGKWHLGSQPQYMPTNRGFDEYYGIPYSNDMWPRPLMQNLDVVEPTANLNTLTQRYTEQAVSFIARAKESPFFLYFPHTFPHIPLGASPRFRGKSKRGIYGDVVQELDWSVGQVLQALEDNGLDGNTLVMFSSDNGPWYQGSAGMLRGRKGETYEGGMREPFIARFPGMIPEGVSCDGVATTMDILPTLARLCGAPLPANQLDGVDIWPMLTGRQQEVDRDVFLYFDYLFIQCARLGAWKLHVARYNYPPWYPDPSGGRRNLPLPHPELYNLYDDPEESYDCAPDYPEIVADIRARIERVVTTLPDPVPRVWQATMAAPVEETPTDGPPVGK